jgi:hypothetical protein
VHQSLPLAGDLDRVLLGHRVIEFPERFELFAGVEWHALDVGLWAFRTRQEE